MFEYSTDILLVLTITFKFWVTPSILGWYYNLTNIPALLTNSNEVHRYNDTLAGKGNKPVLWNGSQEQRTS